MRFIAEISSNFYPAQIYSREPTKTELLIRAIDLIESASGSGATHVKFQLFRAEKLYRSKTKQEELRKLELPISWIPILAQTAKEHGIEFLCTPFYLEAVNELIPYVNEWKIASWDIGFIPLLEKIAQTEMPVILSTGAALDEEIDTAIAILKNNDITLLHCEGGYPTPVSEANLQRIVYLKEKWGFPVGFSSHVVNPSIVAASVAFGATTIEAHYDFGGYADYNSSRFGKGVEFRHSLGQDDFRYMVDLAKQIISATGTDGTVHLNENNIFARNNYRRNKKDWLRPQAGE